MAIIVNDTTDLPKQTKEFESKFHLIELSVCLIILYNDNKVN